MPDDPSNPQNPPTGDPPAGDPPAGDPPQNPPAADDGIDPAVLAGAQNRDAVRNAIKAEREAAAKAKQEAEAAKAEAQKLKDAQLSDQERKDKEAREAREEAESAKAKALKYEVAAAKGVPLSQAHRLQGATKEELEADADAFLSDVNGPAPSFDGGPRGAAQPGDMDAAIRRAAGRP